jgi:hypothetical protein
MLHLFTIFQLCELYNQLSDFHPPVFLASQSFEVHGLRASKKSRRYTDLEYASQNHILSSTHQAAVALRTKMVLDPFTAIGLTGNIVQFVDYSSKLISSTHEIYKSSTGSSRNHVYLEGIATRLLELSRSLEQPELTGSSTHNKALHDLRAQCVEDAKDLLALIKSLQAKKDSKWSSFRKALKSSWEREQVDRLEGRLKDHRSELAAQLTSMLR